jgi:hypothetical protein
MSEFSSLVDSVLLGTHPFRVVDEAVSGPDRKDDMTSDEVRVREFGRIAGQAGSAYPYVGPDWVTAIADQLRGADANALGELRDMAQRNRDEYAGTARIDAGGSFELWDSVLRGLMAVSTDQLPPSPAPLS